MSFELVRRILRSAVSYIPSTSLIAARELRDLPSRVRNRPHEADFAALRSWDLRSPTVIDVGANRGQSIRSLRCVLDDPVIHSCEPIPFLVDHLRSAYGGDSRVVVHPVGLGAAPGVLELFIPRYGHTVYDTRASLSSEEAEAFLTDESFLGFRSSRGGIERVDAQISTLDALGVDADLVKIDVEGMDDQVVAGGRELINRRRPVLIVEFPRPETVTLLSGFGYTRYAYDPAAGRLERGAEATLNTFFLTDDHLPGFGDAINPDA